MKHGSFSSKAFYAAHWLLGKLPGIHAQNGLITVNNHDFRTSGEFIHRKAAALPTYGYDLENDWRVHTVLWAVEHAVRRKAVVVECGTNTGWFMRAALEKHPDLPVYMFDTFQGFDARYPCSNQNPGMPKFEDCWWRVKRTFDQFPNARLIRGTVPDSLRQVLASNIGLLHIDMDCVTPEIEALKWFLPSMVPGGIIIGDDYGHPGFEDQKQAWDAWAREAGLAICSLPTGQALIVV